MEGAGLLEDKQALEYLRKKGVIKGDIIEDESEEEKVEAKIKGESSIEDILKREVKEKREKTKKSSSSNSNENDSGNGKRKELHSDLGINQKIKKFRNPIKKAVF